MATYTTREPRQGRAARALCAGAGFDTTPSLSRPAGPLGAYRAVAREQAQSRWLTGVPEDKKATLIPAGWFESWADATFATDPVGAKMTPAGAARAERRAAGRRRVLLGAASPITTRRKITVPTLLVHAEWDRDTPAYMAQTLFPLLVNAPGKRYVQLPEGTHTIMMEKNRLMLFEAVQAFLDESGKS